MALLITFQNDATGTDDAANYHVIVRVNQRVIEETRVTGHPRAADWRALVRRLVDAPRSGRSDQDDQDG